MDDAADGPVAAAVFRQLGDDMVAYGNGELWSPANEGRALLVPTGRGDYEAEVRRAEARLRHIFASEVRRNVHREGYTTVIHNQGPDLHTDTRRLAA